jgi:SpoVK/Ycf46/Vps4 family AAA+-type ATPase
MKYLLEILKIIDGAVNADKAKIYAYAEQLSRRMEEDGQETSAKRIRRVLANAKMAKLEPSEVTTRRLPVDSESSLSLADETNVPPNSHIVFLSTEANRIVEEFIKCVESSDKLLSHGVEISPSLLLYGPPGCGKTELAYFISSRIKLPLLTARSDSLISSYLGSTAKNLRRLFDHAASRPCILFLDEFDAIAKLRDDQHELGELKRVVISLLQNIDAMDDKTILLAATNHDHLLDPAIWRRFTYRVEIKEPDEEARTKIFRHFAKENTNRDLESAFARITEGLTGAEIRHIIEASRRSAVLSDMEGIDETEILRHVLRIKFPETANQSKSIKEQIRLVREIDPKVFKYERIADLFGISKGQISKLLKQKE